MSKSRPVERVKKRKYVMQTFRATCVNCGKSYVAGRRWQKYCSDQCRFLKHYRTIREALAMYRKRQAR